MAAIILDGNKIAAEIRALRTDLVGALTNRIPDGSIPLPTHKELLDKQSAGYDAMMQDAIHGRRMKKADLAEDDARATEDRVVFPEQSEEQSARRRHRQQLPIIESSRRGDRTNGGVVHELRVFVRQYV